MENADYYVMGNHDRAVAYNEDCHCSIDLHALSAYPRKEISQKLLSQPDIVSILATVLFLWLYYRHQIPDGFNANLLEKPESAIKDPLLSSE